MEQGAGLGFVASCAMMEQRSKKGGFEPWCWGTVLAQAKDGVGNEPAGGKIRGEDQSGLRGEDGLYFIFYFPVAAAPPSCFCVLLPRGLFFRPVRQSRKRALGLKTIPRLADVLLVFSAFERAAHRGAHICLLPDLILNEIFRSRSA